MSVADVATTAVRNALNSTANNITQETINMVARAREANITRDISAGSSNLGWYDLSKPAAVVIPQITPLLNSLQRVLGPGAPAHHFRAIASFGWNNPTGGGFPGVASEGAQGQTAPVTAVDRFNAFRKIQWDEQVTMEALWTSRGLEGDIRSLTQAQCLFTLKTIEENWLTYASDYLWVLPTPLAPTTATTGGTVAAGTYYVGVTALSANGETTVSLSGSTIVTSGATSTISLTFFTEPAATGYNVYVGTASTRTSLFQQVAANYSTGALPTQTVPNLNGSMSIVLTSLTTSGTNPPAANTSMVAKDSTLLTPLTFNGVMAQIFGSGNAVYTALNGVPSTAFSAAGATSKAAANAANGQLGLNGMASIVAQPVSAAGVLAYSDIQNVLLAMFQQARSDPDYMAVSPQDNNQITNILYNATNARLNIDAASMNSLGHLVGGARVEAFVNPTTGKEVRVEVWPFLPQGTIILGSRVLPYPQPGFTTLPLRVIMNQDYMGLDFPPTMSNPQYGIGNFVNETLEMAFPGGFAAITGIIAQ